MRKLLCTGLEFCVIEKRLQSFPVVLVAVYVGRKLMSFWTGEMKVHELYTAACGLYTCWVALRIGLVLYTWIPLGWRAIANKLLEWTLLVSQCSVTNGLSEF